MDALGFYSPINGGLDLVEFLASNFEGFGSLISSKNAPGVIIGDLSLVDPSGLRLIQYHEEGVEVGVEPDNSPRQLDNVLIIDQVRVPNLFTEQINEGNLTNILMALWQVTFHELRHFVQCKEMAKQQQHFFGIEVLDQLEKLSPGISEPARDHIAIYERCVQDQSILAAEVDAVTSSLLTLMHFMRIYDNDLQSFDPFDVVKMLKLTKLQLQNDQSAGLLA
ncbi:hypothetical protein HYZ76_00675 [Candidatus Falkowbacteria bacterium]|nr:hypothetical protein [Candidatus Falkowbacteria bacterium]